MANGAGPAGEGTGPLLAVEHLTVAYGKAEAIRDVSLHVGAGEFVSILGRNGAGKTTLLNAICGLLPKTAGTVRLAGRDITSASTRSILRAGMVPVLDGHRVFPGLTVDDNLQLSMYGKSGSVDNTRLAQAYATFPELEEKRRQPASKLSGGQQQILAVAQGIVAEPRLLLLDEPSGGLAPMVVDRILDVAASLCARGVAVLLVEQLVEKALARSHRCYLMETGRIAHSGLAQAIIGSPVLHDVILGGGEAVGPAAHARG